MHLQSLDNCSHNSMIFSRSRSSQLRNGSITRGVCHFSKVQELLALTTHIDSTGSIFIKIHKLRRGYEQCKVYIKELQRGSENDADKMKYNRGSIIQILRKRYGEIIINA